MRNGVDIITTDDYSWKSYENSEWWHNHRMWTHVESLDAIEAVGKYGTQVNIIIMSWAFMDDIAVKVLNKMREVNHCCIMFVIGEGRRGCTANDEFFETIKEIGDEEFNQAISNFKHWIGLHDYPMLVK